ncbi:MAG TPA: hypothetical protein VEY30_03150, partial [Myxococcaceae bacterium]|nr:hypothetical protein [Myxococcaceae bacterium]
MHFALRRGSLLWAVALIACGGERPPAFVDRLPGAPGRPDELPEAPEPPLPCAPLSCETAGSGCGIVPDGCGGQLTCGECGVGQTCGGGGVPNVCGAPPVTPPPAPALPTWVRRLGGSQNDSGLAVTADADNNVYLAWSSVRRESSGAPPAPGGDERQAVSLSKYAPDGTLRWTR